MAQANKRSLFVKTKTNKQQFSYLFPPGENYARNFKTIFSAEYAILKGK